MKPSVLKTLGAIGVVAVTWFGVEAASQPTFPSRSQTGTVAMCVPLPDGGFFYELLDIKLNPRQLAAYDALSASLSAREARREKHIRTVEIPGAQLTIEMKDSTPPGVVEAIIEFQDAMIRDNVPVEHQLKALAGRYGRYALFYKPRALMLSAEQRAQLERDKRADEARMRSILTPEQRSIYEANLFRMRQIEACEVN
jgi:hypothetical protein